MNFSPSLFLLGACLALLWGSIEATCACKEVCPSYTDLWKIASDCPAEGLLRCVKSYVDRGGRLICLKSERAPEGGCVCNVFGCNCDGCGCHSGRRLRSTIISSKPKEDSCDDYDFYTGMSDKERNAHLIEKHCRSMESPVNAADLRTVLENLADSNQDGSLSCEEFNAASFDFDASELCGWDR